MTTDETQQDPAVAPALAAVTTFALGTAAGDLPAVTLHLGYLKPGLLLAAVVVIPALARARAPRVPGAPLAD